MTTTEDTKIDSVTTSYGFSQNISNPSNILPNSYSCIDLIFINQPNLVIESRVHPSLHQNSYNQSVFARHNLKIQCPLLYEHLTWDYKNVNEQLINHKSKGLIDLDVLKVKMSMIKFIYVTL